MKTYSWIFKYLLYIECEKYHIVQVLQLNFFKRQAIKNTALNTAKT